MNPHGSGRNQDHKERNGFTAIICAVNMQHGNIFSSEKMLPCCIFSVIIMIMIIIGG